MEELVNRISAGQLFFFWWPKVLDYYIKYKIIIYGSKWFVQAEATTSLPFREFFQCETLEFQLEMFYPEFWNSYQASSSFYIIRVPAGNVLPGILEQLSCKFFLYH